MKLTPQIQQVVEAPQAEFIKSIMPDEARLALERGEHRVRGRRVPVRQLLWLNKRVVK